MPLGSAAEFGKHHKRLASDFPGFKLPAPHAQAQSRLRRQRLERYAALPAEFIRANGGDKFAAPVFALGVPAERGKGGAS